MKHWYLIAYDIREPKRLRKLHYLLKNQAHGIQKSVFLIQVNRTELKNLLNNIRNRVNLNDDDVRLYPVPHPNAIWASGKQAGSLQGLYSGEKTSEENSGFFKFVKSLFGEPKK